ncbi:MAG TPA: stage II sporulation protein P [Bacillota bacterium]|nr:stage II sporulation protein P [Bacillota bacterium]HPZ21554.1 stage II sporulation protein P [Bacillota bacterium]HQD19579.1 stage II sporulation protein P [Bacillota bacterium]
MNNKRKILGILLITLLLVLFIVASNGLAPAAARYNSLNPYYLLSLGAPGVFYEDIDALGPSFKLEPWRILGLQMPVFASIDPGEWQEVTGKPPVNNVSPGPGLPRSGKVGIYHTHTSEAFVPTAGQARSEDFSQTVVCLGEVIAAKLTASNIPVIHVKKYHDPVYKNSYTESRKSAQEMLAAHPDISLIMDIHRDGVGKTAESGRKMTTATVNNLAAGRIMFVISSAHPDWQKNQRIANDLHNIIEEKYPGLSRGIVLRLDSAFHQDLHPGAILVEIGGHWNTLEEAIYGAELFADVLIEYYGGAR